MRRLALVRMSVSLASSEHCSASLPDVHELLPRCESRHRIHRRLGSRHKAEGLGSPLPSLARCLVGVVVGVSQCPSRLALVFLLSGRRTISFSANNNTQCLATNAFTFNNNSSISSGTLTYAWNLGNGITSTNQNPNYSYPNDGNYTVTLLATSNYGCTDSSKINISVKKPPLAQFSINDTIQVLSVNNFIFSNLTNTYGEIVTYLWKFGNGNSSYTLNQPYPSPPTITHNV